jgi:hypothetical protein
MNYKSCFGPVRIPKIYDGHNRTFFTFGYEGTRQRGYGQAVSSVPTAAMVAGDFSAVGSIFDPATTRPNPAGAGFVRTPFPGNIIPGNRVDPVAQKVLPLGYPLPNRAGVANNYVTAGPTINNVDSFNARVDHNFNDKNRLTGRYIGQRVFLQSLTRYPGPAGAGDTNLHLFENTQNQVVSVEDTYLIRPSLVNTLRFGYFYERTNWIGTRHRRGLGRQDRTQRRRSADIPVLHHLLTQFPGWRRLRTAYAGQQLSALRHYAADPRPAYAEGWV